MVVHGTKLGFVFYK